jgi:hypothetical protein
MERMLEHFERVERLFGHLEQRQAKQHVRSSVKEWLQASRAVIDSVIDTLEEERYAPPEEETVSSQASDGPEKRRKSTRNINITKG